jgi:hypothetical protein
LAEFVLELNRVFISEGGVEPAAVIDGFEEGADALAGLYGFTLYGDAKSPNDAARARAATADLWRRAHFGLKAGRLALGYGQRAPSFLREARASAAARPSRARA